MYYVDIRMKFIEHLYIIMITTNKPYHFNVLCIYIRIRIVPACLSEFYIKNSTYTITYECIYLCELILKLSIH